MIAFSPQVAERIRSTDHRIVVTGVGGWLGTATLEMLDAALQGELEARVGAYASSSRRMQLSSGRTIAVRPLDELVREEEVSTYILHYAYLGKEKVAQLGVEQFVATNVAINDLVERYCQRIPRGGLFFASSGAAHFASGSAEDSDREPYGAAKVRDEARFLRLAAPGFTVCACRIFNMAGPFINKLADYALSSILLDILNGGPIVIRANRRVLRSFVHVRDVVELAVQSLLQGDAPRDVFDTAGNEVVEVGELAERAARLLGAPEMRIERPPLVHLAEDRYVGDGATYQALMKKLGILPATLDVQILQTAEYLKRQNFSA